MIIAPPDSSCSYSIIKKKDFTGFHRRPDKTDKIKVSVAVVLPHSMFKERLYKKQIMLASEALSGVAIFSPQLFTIDHHCKILCF